MAMVFESLTIWFLTLLGILVAPLDLNIVRDDEMGIQTRKLGGKKLPEWQIIARNGEVGIQAEALRPGLYWRSPFVLKIAKAR